MRVSTLYFIIFIKKGHTIKPGTMEHRTTEHGTPVEQRNTARAMAHHRNREQRNAGNNSGIAGTPRNTRITEHHRS